MNAGIKPITLVLPGYSQVNNFAVQCLLLAEAELSTRRSRTCGYADKRSGANRFAGRKCQAIAAEQHLLL